MLLEALYLHRKLKKNKNMKKVLSFVFVASMITLASCGKAEQAADTATTAIDSAATAAVDTIAAAADSAKASIDSTMKK